MNAQNRRQRVESWQCGPVDESRPRPLRLVERQGEGDTLRVLSPVEARMLDEPALRLRFSRMMAALLPGVVAEMILAGRQPENMTKGEILAFLSANAAWLGPV